MNFALIFGLHSVISGPIYKGKWGRWYFVFSGLSIDDVAQPGDRVTIFES